MNKQLDLNSISRSIAYGNIAFWLGKKADQSQSYRWICFVRGINNEDISYFVKEVVFTLHPSFPNHIRVVNSFPFEILEHGWGEFDINIKIYFKEEYQKPVELFHLLKLHPSVPNVITTQKKPLISEFYDEIVFLNPSVLYFSFQNIQKQFAEIIQNFDQLQNEQKQQMEQEKEEQELLQQEQQQELQEKQQDNEMNEQEQEAKESENQIQNETIKEEQDQQISSEQEEQPQQQQQRANLENQSKFQIFFCFKI